MNPDLMHQWDAAIARQERDAARAEVARLRAEVEALREDAERYRWLRDNAHLGWMPMVAATTGRNMGITSLDSAIDAARKESK